MLLACLAVIVWATAPAASADDARSAKIAARQHFFGLDNVNPKTGTVPRNRVILSWFGVSSLAMAIEGHVVLLDAYVNTAQGNDFTYVGTSYRELADLKPEALFIGHAHSDHGVGVSYLADRNPRLRIYGTPEHCDQARADAAANGYAAPGACFGVVSPGSAPGAEVNDVPALRGVRVRVVKHLHSALQPPDLDYPPTGLPLMTLDPPTLLMHPPGPSAAEPSDGGINTAGNEGSSLLWQFKVGGFTFTWNDTNGPLKEQQPQVFDVLRDRLWPTDVHAGALAGLDIPNFWRDPALYEKELRSRLFIPLHHDFPTAYGLNRDWKRLYREWLGVVGIPVERQPRFHWISDPDDYLEPIVLDPRARIWRAPRP